LHAGRAGGTGSTVDEDARPEQALVIAGRRTDPENDIWIALMGWSTAYRCSRGAHFASPA
jgi:hypothetical protein